MERALELASVHRPQGPEACGMCGGAAAEKETHAARAETVIDLDDGLSLGATDGGSRRKRESLDAPIELRREQHGAPRHEPIGAELRSPDIAVPLCDSTLPLSTDSRRTAGRPQAPAPRFDARTRLLLDGPILGTLLRLATPNVLVMFVQASVGLIETYFVAKLGTDALAGIALVFPVLMLMQMMSAGAMGGGISSATARALGAGRRAEADALVFHALAIAGGFGLLFMLVVLGSGRWLYSAMGGTGAALTAALTYSDVVFTGALLVWTFNSLASAIRGTGNMAVPAIVTCAGAVALIPLSPCLIFGWGPFPEYGIAGGAVAVIVYYAAGTLVFATYLWAGRSVVRLSFHNARLRWPLFRAILRVGAVAALVTIQTNLTIAIATGLVGRFGPAAIAGYGTGARLEYLLVPLVFGLGAPLVAMVGTNLGAGQRERALHSAWIGAGLATGLTELIGLGAAAFPHAWLSLFGTDPAMVDCGARYLRAVGPCYGLYGLGLALYFASQGAGRLLWPLLANLTRLVIAGGGGWLAQRWGGDVSHVFLALSAALAAFGLINAVAVAGGAWFGPVGWPRMPTAWWHSTGLRPTCGHRTK